MVYVWCWSCYGANSKVLNLPFDRLSVRWRQRKESIPSYYGGSCSASHNGLLMDGSDMTAYNKPFTPENASHLYQHVHEYGDLEICHTGCEPKPMLQHKGTINGDPTYDKRYEMELPATISYRSLANAISKWSWIPLGLPLGSGMVLQFNLFRVTCSSRRIPQPSIQTKHTGINDIRSCNIHHYPTARIHYYVSHIQQHAIENQCIYWAINNNWLWGYHIRQPYIRVIVIMFTRIKGNLYYLKNTTSYANA